MDAFEDLVARLLNDKGHWTVQGYRINLSKEDKVAIGLPSMPRPEVDVLAYRPDKNVLWWVECKSYLDSPGVRSSAFEPGNPGARFYRVFTDPRFREIASNVLKEQVLREGLARKGVDIRYCLVGGHFYRDNQRALEGVFDANGWRLHGPDWIVEGLRRLSSRAYEDDIVTIAVKLLARNPPSSETD